MTDLQDITAILDAYYQELTWLESLMTDREGARYFEKRTRQSRLQIYRRRLARVTDFLDFAGNPQHSFHSVHVAGTSGKGSVVTMLSAMLRQAGILTGQHISPYLEVCNEKLVVDGKMISPSAFTELVGHLRTLIQGYKQHGKKYKSIKYSDAWTALVYLWFAEQKVDWAVVETGMGGRYDATNALPSSLAVITNINYDHIAELGPRLEDIAWQKAGIIKQGMPVVTGETNPDVLKVIFREARRKSAPIYTIGNDFSYTIQKLDASGIWMDVQGPFNHYKRLFVPVQGAFQAENAAVAVAALDVLNHVYQLPVSPALVREALGNYAFAGRMEIMQQNPLVLLDGAHNPHKMSALVDSIRMIYPGKKITGLVGLLGMKDAEQVLEILLPILDRLIITMPHVLGKPALDPVRLAEIAQSIAPHLDIQVETDVSHALAKAKPLLDPDHMLLVTGSLYLIGEARTTWISKFQMLQNAESEVMTYMEG